MQYPEAVYALALRRIPGVGAIMACRLMEQWGSAQAVFAKRHTSAACTHRIQNRLMQALDNPIYLQEAAQEYELMQSKGIGILTWNTPDYPPALNQCVDAPPALFAYGDIRCLHSSHLLSVVGTRNITHYGKAVTRHIIGELAKQVPDTVIVSGLAYGVDIAAHEAALQCGLKSVAVLGHGLDRIYPYRHTATAKQLVSQGALVTEYSFGTKPERYHFVGRNRIIAGLSPATLVIESAEKGGSLITADLAIGYDRDVLAVPGRVGDPYSQGCNRLISEHRAQMVTSADDIVAVLGWDEGLRMDIPELPFAEPDLPDSPLLKILRQADSMHINDLARQAGMDIRSVTAELFDLELDGYVMAIPGGLYSLSPRQ